MSRTDLSLVVIDDRPQPVLTFVLLDDKAEFAAGRRNAVDQKCHRIV